MDDYLFKGLRVIDCATVIAAPTAAMMLADFGADVIKVEQPGEGDMLRMLSHVPTAPEAGNDWFWNLDGRNKRVLSLNLKDAEALEILRELVVGCDVFITNQPFEVRSSLKITYEQLSELNPKMIYASLSAYGEKGPDRARKGFDQVAYWGRSGLMDLMRNPGKMPSQGLPGMGDHPTGVALYASIVTALLRRERTGKGSLVHTSLLANGLWSAAGVAQGALTGGDMKTYRENSLIYSATFRPYRTRDNRWLQLNMIRNEELLAMLLVAIDATELLSDPRFATMEDLWPNREALGDEIQERIGQKDATDWIRIFEEYDVPAYLIVKVEDLESDEQLVANGMIETPSDATMGMKNLIKHPLNIEGLPRAPHRRAPTLGEHTQEILEEIGYSQEEITRLQKKGAVQ